MLRWMPYTPGSRTLILFCGRHVCGRSESCLVSRSTAWCSSCRRDRTGASLGSACGACPYLSSTTETPGSHWSPGELAGLMLGSFADFHAAVIWRSLYSLSLSVSCIPLHSLLFFSQHWKPTSSVLRTDLSLLSFLFHKPTMSNTLINSSCYPCLMAVTFWFIANNRFFLYELYILLHIQGNLSSAFWLMATVDKLCKENSCVDIPQVILCIYWGGGGGGGGGGRSIGLGGGWGGWFL